MKATHLILLAAIALAGILLYGCGKNGSKNETKADDTSTGGDTTAADTEPEIDTRIPNSFYTYKNDTLELTFTDFGDFSSVKVMGKEIIGYKSPAAALWIDGAALIPDSMTVEGDALRFAFPGDRYALLAVEEKASCITLTVRELSDCDSFVFGPLPTLVGDAIGGCICTAFGDGLAIGVQALNEKTLPGLPDGYPSPYGDKYTSSASKSLFAFTCRDYTLAERKANYNGVTGMTVAAPDDESSVIPGAAIAIFGSTQDGALEKIGELELDCGLPHPLINGEWVKTSRETMRTYLITDYSIDNIEKIAELASVAGMTRISHGEAFENWGHFDLKTEYFPNGDSDLKAASDIASKYGIRLGVHVLTNFITTNDLFVTPEASEHLLEICPIELVEDLSRNDSEIHIKQCDQFVGVELRLGCVRVGKEIISFGSYFDKKDGTAVITGCSRGAFGTSAADHAVGEDAALLWDHDYETFFADATLQNDMCDRLAELFRECNLGQLSFDGLEGCRYTGRGTLDSSRFVSRCFYGWNDIDENGAAPNAVVTDASNLNHFDWHMQSYMNWGEPWGKSMKEGQLDRRLANQETFVANLFPRMFGWFEIRDRNSSLGATTVDELEWLCGVTSGYDAGYCLSVKPSVFESHGQFRMFMELVHDWDTLRLGQAFTDEQRERMRDVTKGWHLQNLGDGNYRLFEASVSDSYTYNYITLQPGQPSSADWDVTTVFGGDFGFRLVALGGGTLINPTLKTPGGTITFPCTVTNSQRLIYNSPEFDGKAYVTDSNYNIVAEVTPVGTASLNAGSSEVFLSCDDHEAAEGLEVSVVFETSGEGEDITYKAQN